MAQSHRFKGIVAAALTLILCLALPATAATPKSGKWKGDTDGADGSFVEFKTTGKKTKHVDDFVLREFDFTCTPGSGHQDRSISVAKPKVKKGKFSFKETNADQTVKASGKFTKNNKASGTVSWSQPNPFGDGMCKTGKLEWTAKLK